MRLSKKQRIMLAPTALLIAFALVWSYWTTRAVIAVTPQQFSYVAGWWPGFMVTLGSVLAGILLGIGPMEWYDHCEQAAKRLAA